MQAGTVLSTAGGTYEVRLRDGATIEAVLRGRLKRNEKDGGQVVAGDEVSVSPQPDGGFAIEAVEPRRSLIARRAPGAGRARQKLIAANIDRIVIVFAAARPEPNPRMLDRFLILAESSDVEALIILNKTDLVEPAVADAFLSPYVEAGYATLKTTAKAGIGIDTLRTILCGSSSALTGPSGVGKSSLLNAVQPGLGLRIGDVSEAVNKGMHTTVAARFIPMDCGGYVADTPGLREVGMWDVDASDLAMHFPEFRDRIDDCRFGSSCTHTHEPRCAVREAVDTGAIDAGRYDSYRTLFEECSSEGRQS